MDRRAKATGLGSSIKISRRDSRKKHQSGKAAIIDEPSGLKFQSCTEQTDLQELLQLAELSGADFIAGSHSTIMSSLPEDMADSKSWIRIPRRPKWDTMTTSIELSKLENENFLEWRRGLASIEDSGRFIMTPFERNIDIWRQLWRVIEACDVLVQIVDARNPLLFYCEDLCSYISEVDPSKRQLLLINKADFLSTHQRENWAHFFASIGKEVFFYSAKDALELPCESEEIDAKSHDILGRANLLAVLKSFSSSDKVGLIGYPNVGKSSTINSLVGSKKVSVASTPGKTKHFQTLRLENGLLLHDCPGLVFPNFAASKADLVLNGILSIDQLRDWHSPTDLLLHRIPSRYLSVIYGIKTPTTSDENPIDKFTSFQLLSSFADMRGFRTSFHGNPDESRAARIILKDYVNGKLLFCSPPPGIEANEFNQDSWRVMNDQLKLKEGPPAFSGNTRYSVLCDQILVEDRNHAVFIEGMTGTAYSKKAVLSKDKKHWKSKKGGHGS